MLGRVLHGAESALVLAFSLQRSSREYTNVMCSDGLVLQENYIRVEISCSTT